MHCVNCGVEVAPPAKFCQNCGNAVLTVPDTSDASPAERLAQSAESPPEKKTTMESISGPPRRFRKHQLIKRLGRTALITVVVIIISKFVGYAVPFVHDFLAKADAFVWTGVKEGQPFHFLAVFYREWAVHGGSPPVAFVRAIGDVIKEGPAAVLTMALVLFIGISVAYDRKNLLNTLYTTLFLGPIIGGCLLYVVMGAMAGLFVIFGVGAKVCTYIGTMVPLVREGVNVTIESRKEKMAEKMVDRISEEVRTKA